MEGQQPSPNSGPQGAWNYPTYPLKRRWDGWTWQSYLPHGPEIPPLNSKHEDGHRMKQTGGEFPPPRATIYSPPEAGPLLPFPTTFQSTTSLSHYARLPIAPATSGTLNVEFRYPPVCSLRCPVVVRLASERPVPPSSSRLSLPLAPGDVPGRQTRGLASDITRWKTGGRLPPGRVPSPSFFRSPTAIPHNRDE